MDRRAFDVFRNAPPDYVGYVKKIYNVSTDDQDGAQYALVEIEPDDPNMSHDPALTIVTEADFGTTIDREVIDKDFQISDSGPDNPLMPESGGTYKTVDIANTLAGSGQGLQTFAAELMKGTTVDPLSSHYGYWGASWRTCIGSKRCICLDDFTVC